ncbi:hypothetical protein EA772_01380 [Pedobacter sp. G11]|uniref:DUF7683 domain-containing protein n=1 Tax=Pedobacter sp. G11 TaxID=2482728 RepID=UPI000F5E9113|nr:hypothetical protein [Pedobacter sp. G11]AZI24058.1 hypothetical protein EA772_01380 [Pedobacter sp. G11]
MKIERIISWFNKTNEELLGEYNIDHIDLDILKQIFPSKEEDPLLYDPYTIHRKEAKKLQPYLKDFTFELEKFIYQIDCFQL